MSGPGIPESLRRGNSISTVHGIHLPEYDYVSYTNTDTTTDTYTFKKGGASGITVATLVLVYTDTTKVQISTVTKT